MGNVNFILWEYYGKNYYIPILWALKKNLLNYKTHAIPRYGKQVSMDFPMYLDIFYQLMENRYEPYLSQSWILRDFSCVVVLFKVNNRNTKAMCEISIQS